MLMGVGAGSLVAIMSDIAANFHKASPVFMVGPTCLLISPFALDPTNGMCKRFLQSVMMTIHLMMLKIPFHFSNSKTTALLLGKNN